jgi:hypothetical protein
VTDAHQLGHLGERRTLHLDRGGAVLLVEAAAGCRRVDEDVAGDDRPDHDPRVSAGDRKEGEAGQPVLDHRQQAGIGLEAQVIGRVEEREVPGLVHLEAVVVQDPGVVLDEPMGNDHVADPEGRVQAAGDSGEHEGARSRGADQEGGDRAHGHLPDPTLGQDDLMTVEPARPGLDAVSQGQRRPWFERGTQRGELRIERGDDGDGSSAGHGRDATVRPMLGAPV